MPVLLFWLSAGLMLTFLLLSVIFNSLIGRIFGYITILLCVAAMFFASYEWRRIEITLLFVLSVLLVYLILSLIRLAIEKRTKREEGTNDL